MELFLIIFGIALLVLLSFCVPILIQIWRTSKDIAVTIETLNRSLPSILKNLEDITTNIKSSTGAVNREVQNLANSIGCFQLVVRDVVDDFQHVASVTVNLPQYQMIKNIVAVVKGLRVFVDVFLNNENIPSAKVSSIICPK